MNKKLLFIILFTIFIFLFLILSLFFKRPSLQNTKIQPTITLAPTNAPKATDLYIVNFLPQQQPSSPYLPLQKITLLFSDEIDPSSLKYEVSPPTDILLRGEGKTIYIIPRTSWQIGQTKITILKNTTAKNGKKLYQNLQYIMSADIPPVPSGIFDAP